MQLTLKTLDSNLTKTLLPIYLINSDELLFIEEARNKILTAARTQGFTDRDIMHAETGFQWEHFTQATQNTSLFSDKTLIDLRNHGAKFDNLAADALMKFAAKPCEDILVILSTKKLTSAQQKTKWYKAIDKIGACITTYPPRINEYPQWIQHRAREYKIDMSIDAAKLLAQATEGNLFAGAQAIDKCALLFPSEAITPDKITTVIANNAQFSVFDLSNALLAGKAKRAIKILTTLKQSGTEPILVLWAIARETRELLQMKSQLQQGKSISQILSLVWTSKKPYVQNALKTISIETLKKSLESMARIDMMIKGAQTGDPWQSLTDVCLLLSNHTALTVS